LPALLAGDEPGVGDASNCVDGRTRDDGRGASGAGAAAVRRGRRCGHGGRHQRGRVAAESCCGPAAGESSGCCSAGSCAPQTIEVDGGFGSGLYSAHERGELPAEALAASLGCGNPTALAELCAGERVLDLGSGGGIDVSVVMALVASLAGYAAP
jgi:hypothetical protein